MRKTVPLSATLALAALLAAPIARAESGTVAIGDLVKCPDFTSVYFLGEDGKRHVFPNEQMFFSWFPDFSDIKTISCEDLASLPLGENVVYQAGTRLVKLPSVPTVYAVEDDGVLRAVTSEAQARELFGDDWASRVDDVPEGFFPSFTKGEALAPGEIPDGILLTDDDGSLFRIEDGEAIEISSVLDIDQEDVLEDHALVLEDLEERIGVALALTRVSAEQAIEVLKGVLEKLQAINAADDDEVDGIDIIDVLNEAADDKADAEDNIEDAEKAITKAKNRIARQEARGEDVAEAESSLVAAESHIAEAKSALASGDYAEAELHAEQAEHDADAARGKVDDDDLDEIEDEDEGEEEDEEINETEDENESEHEEDDSDEDSDESNEDEDEDEEDDEGEDNQ